MATEKIQAIDKGADGNNYEIVINNLIQRIQELEEQNLNQRVLDLEFYLKNGETAIKYVSATSGGPTTDEIQFVHGIFIQA